MLRKYNSMCNICIPWSVLKIRDMLLFRVWTTLSYAPPIKYVRAHLVAGWPLHSLSNLLYNEHTMSRTTGVNETVTLWLSAKVSVKFSMRKGRGQGLQLRKPNLKPTQNAGILHENVRFGRWGRGWGLDGEETKPDARKKIPQFSMKRSNSAWHQR